MPSIIRALFLLSGLVFFLASGAEAQDEPFAGTWRIVSASPAPWVNPNSIPDTQTEPFLGQEIAFLAGHVDGPAPFGCAGATYESVDIPPQGLFQGGLGSETAEPLALSLGIIGEAATLQVTCDTGVFDYHSSGHALLTALDNVIYTLERQEQP